MEILVVPADGDIGSEWNTMLDTWGKYRAQPPQLKTSVVFLATQHQAKEVFF